MEHDEQEHDGREDPDHRRPPWRGSYSRSPRLQSGEAITVANSLSPGAKQQFFDNNGNPLAGGKLFTYAAGTSTKLATKVSSAGADNQNPIILDYRGECDLWIPPNVAYKYILAPSTDTDPPTHAIWTVDQIVSLQLITLYGGVDTGSVNAYVLTFTASFTAYADGIILYWLPANTSTGASTLNVNGLGAVPLVDNDGSSLATGRVVANIITGVIYRGGKFYLLSPSVVSGSFTATITGVVGTVTGTVKYRIVNNICTLYVDASIVGTSNTVALTMLGLPTATIPSGPGGRTVPCASLADNGGTGVMGVANVSPAGVITFALMNVVGAQVLQNGAFTAANNKGVGSNWVITYPL